MTTTVAAALRIPAASESPPRWHVSPLVDALAYHWSWAFMLVPLMFTGDEHPVDYRFLMMLTLAVNFTHQALTMPFVYLDSEVFRGYRLRFTIMPAIMVALFVTSLVTWRHAHPAFRSMMPAIFVVAYSWNLWHVYMQKYGILRLYNAKAGGGVPGWVDRLLVFGWLPLYFPLFAKSHGHLLRRTYKYADSALAPLLDFLVTQGWWLLPLGVVVLASSLIAWTWHEWRANRFGNAPRLSMALGTTTLGACLVLYNPVKGVIAYGFSHVFEYCVFAWAYQRRRYREPLPHRPLVARFLKHPGLAFTTFVVLVTAGYGLLSGWAYIFPDRPRLMLGSFPLSAVLALVALYLSMVHFYFDGFLWKMRKATVRANI
jgi:hypothetical protein